MKKFIDELVKKGLTPIDALTIVRNIAASAFEEGEHNLNYEGYAVAEKTFNEWFKEEINR
jgi:hypothetical protein